ncbi:hypothetical protein [Ornithinimicrobium faecis]|uniref:hypothetical protein n=1 Tax=Ornithinimicrobium faecis TaxID=2934158 RepID=UPI0021193E98|nr:hypothetical protein [Ornithinimicrobium sp. HY1745]
MTTHIKPDETWVDVTIYHSLDPELREFNATIVALVGEEPEEPEEIGELGGHLCRTLQEHCLGGATDDLNTETAVLGQVVDDIVGALTNAGSDEGVSSALLINPPVFIDGIAANAFLESLSIR